MNVAVGTRLGVYDIVGLLGRGGMGEVYHARDGRLLRDVAIKLLPSDLADDKARLDRFQREAVLLAAVTHPNVAVIHGLEETSGTRFLVMELVPGPTLADRLKHGPLSLARALNVSRQLVEALDAAHQRGVIHRDLKPANIKVSDDGRVKILDFGLAKSLTEEPGAESEPPSTVTAIQAGSQAVVVMGTPAYMSPEQARGAAVDRRADIWAFGCVVYEMFTGSRAFDGETPSDAIAAVLEREPGWSALPSDTPGPVQALLRRCLQKDAARRLRDIGDARFDIEEARAPSVATPREEGTAPRRARAVIAVGTALMLVAAIAASRYAQSTTGISDVLQFRLSAPLDAQFPLPPQFAVSPNGRLITFVATYKGSRALWLRSLDAVDAKPLAGTEGAAYPFWSPDSQFAAFFGQGKLKKLKVSGGQPVDLADASLPSGGTWNKDNDIVFAPTPTSGLQRVSANGGSATPLASKARRGEVRQRWPQFLPDGRHFPVNLTDEGT
ncbi:MAG TPA: serine/threonine-protein kinase [Vicinamibacterales bacterium]|nr:serine/threonine-protein kinase [Vicinamibacterales bacterium]